MRVPFGDRVDPLLELDVVGADEPLPPVGRHPAGELALPLDDDPAALGQFDGAGLAEDLAADVVAVGDVHGRLDVHQRAVGHLEHQDQRVLQLLGRQAAAPRVEHWVATTSEPRSQREVSMSCTQVSTMTPSVVTLSGTAGLRCAEWNISGRADRRPRSSASLHRPVAVVVAAHEADHDQPPAGGDLGVEDPLARLLGGRQRLLAEHLLAGRDAGQHVLLVGADPRRRRRRRRHPGSVDQLLPGLVEPWRRAVRPPPSCARSRSTSVTAETRAPDRTWVSRRMWSWPIIPTPMTPTLTVT